MLTKTGHKGTIRYIVDTLKSLGGYYDVSLQPFDVVMGIVYESHLVLGDKVIGDALPLKNTPATASKEPVHSRLVLAAKSGCNASDYDAAKNKIVLVKRGDCALGDKSELAGRAGAKALVIYNTKDEDFYGTVGEPKPDHVATFSIRSSYGEPLAKKLLNGEAVDAIAYIDGSVETIHTQNVLAQTTSGDPNHCIMLGGHSDGVDAGPGINDDGSGSISVLEIAVQLAKFRVNNCVRFAWWSAEEEGLLGSNYYAYHLSPAENQKIRLFVDLDMLASPNYAYQIYNATNDENPAGSEEYRDLLAEWYKAQGLNSMYTEFDGRSDYVGFIQNGIPAGGFSTGAEGVKTEEEVELFGGVAGEWYDKNYHQIGDDLANLNMTAWEMNTKVRFFSPTMPRLFCYSDQVLLTQRSSLLTLSPHTPALSRDSPSDMRSPPQRLRSRLTPASSTAAHTSSSNHLKYIYNIKYLYS